MARSFTSIYDENVDIDVGDGFTITVKKYLSDRDFEAAAAALVRNRKYKESGVSTEITGDFDAFAYNRTLVERALVAWTLTKDNPNDPAGEPVAIPIEDWKRGRFTLPQPVFRQVLVRVLELNNEADQTPEERLKSAKADADFRAEDTGSTTGE
jgi:hypothetical protein